MEVEYTPKPPDLVMLRERGQLTIPAEIRREMGAREGDVFSIIRLGNSLVVTKKRFLTPEIARNIERMMQEQAVTLDDLLAGVDEQRAAYLKEHYGTAA